MELVIVNLHLSHVGEGRPAEDRAPDDRRPRRRARTGGEPIVLAGDFNLTSAAEGLQELVAAGYSPPGPGIDHILVRGAPATAVSVWPVERRTVEGRVLSDHSPVELRVG